MSTTYRYDALISYRRQDPDQAFARDLWQRLEKAGLKVCIDGRDFKSREGVRDEMERCVRESRYTLAVVSHRYLESGHCQEEAIFRSILDRADGERRLIPLYLERVEPPAWLTGLVGIHFHESNPAVDPYEKLLQELQAADAPRGYTYAPPRKKVAISSNLARDLPTFVKPLEDGCLRMDCAPLPAEPGIPADEAELAERLRRVDEADLYVGVFAHRYGFVPAGKDVSLVELEYDRAGQRKIPRFVFLLSDNVPVLPRDMETGPGAEKLKRFKERIVRDVSGRALAPGPSAGEHAGDTPVRSQGSTFVITFTTPDDLRAKAVAALQPLREPRPVSMHYISDIPAPPEVYVAHPYTLLQAGRLIGRQPELTCLTDWVAQRGSRPFESRMFFLVAIGGQGKSALAWHWFQTIAEQEMKPLAGRIWWSFYESDASFENFVTRALAYVTRRPLDELRKLPPFEREERLLRVLDREPHLLVLDGLERVLLAYSGANVSRLQDDELDQATANYVARAYGLPETATQSFTGQHRLRRTADPRVGAFLRKLTQVKAARVLVSTRLYPADLQVANGEPVASCFAYFLPGLSDPDALELWRGYGAKGSRERLLPMFATFGKHPLLIQALASVVAHDRRAVGDFDQWHAQHPDFDPFPLLHANERKSHVLSHALRGLDESQLRLLQTIAAFRMPTDYETLVTLFVKCEVGSVKCETDPSHFTLPTSHFVREPELDAALTTLEDRGLLGWDRRANRYDLHPIVRGVVWSELDAARRRDVCGTLHAHFAPIEVPYYLNVESLDDLTPAIELFHTLIELERYEDAFRVFRDRIHNALRYRLSTSRPQVEMVERLFPDGLDHSPRLSSPWDQGYTLNALAQAYVFSGQPGAAVPVFRLASELAEQEKDQRNLSVGLCNLSYAERLSGDVRAAEASAREALRIGREWQDEFREAVSLRILGLALASRSAAPDISNLQSQISNCESPISNPLAALEQSLQLFQKQPEQQSEGVVNAYLAEVALWLGDAATARTRADRAWELAAVRRYEADLICAARLQGTAALRSPEFAAEVSGRGLASAHPLTDFIHERLHHALTRARACQLVQEELPTLIALAELHHATAVAVAWDSIPSGMADWLGTESQATSLAEARRLLDDVWDRAERGPYPLFHADALNLLSQIERTTAAFSPPSSSSARDALTRARDAAERAYRLSWLQGPPFTYAHGLYHARKHLTALGHPEPTLPDQH